MKCFNCEKEAVFSVDCLMVSHTVIPIGNGKARVEEAFCGTTKTGLCEKCRKIASYNCKDLIGPSWLGLTSGILLIVGLLLFFLGLRFDFPAFVRTIGIVLAVVFGLYLLIRNLFSSVILKKTPWKVMNRRGFYNDQTDSTLLVPLGDGYYKNYKQFRAVNTNLYAETAKNIYSGFIENGQWKVLVENNDAENSK